MEEPKGSVTRLFDGVSRNEPQAIEELWRRYVARVEGVARPVLERLPTRESSAEDVAQSAFRAFFSMAARGQASELTNRDELWRLLRTITKNKSTDYIRRGMRKCRGGNVTHAANLSYEIPANSPTSSEYVSAQESLDILLADLDQTGDTRLRRIALMRLAGLSNEDIAAELKCTTRTIQRKIILVQRLWALRDSN